jgi:uncharacterized damage-inducible protein DinB
VIDDEYAKRRLQDEIRWVRRVLVWKLEGLSEYDVRRPLTDTGTNLLGLIKHCATWEARYLGEVFGRPFPQPLPRWDDVEASGTDLWAAADETCDRILSFAQRVAEHADATIEELPLDAPGHVPWWPRPDVTLFDVMVHLAADATRHAGHADILREQLDGRTGFGPGHDEPIDPAAREAHRARIERAARAAAERA